MRESLITVCHQVTRLQDRCDVGNPPEELFRGSEKGVRKRTRVFVGDSIVLNKGDEVVVCLPGAKIEAITERVENIVGSG